MKKFVLAFLASVLFASTTHADSPAPPTSLVLIACRAEVISKFPDHVRPLPRHTYYQLHINDGQEYECKRVPLLDLQEEIAFGNENFDPLEPRWDQYGQCARVSMMQAAKWNEANPGWLAVAVGCPRPIVSNGKIVGWAEADCPVHMPGTSNRMKCNFSENEV